jgi:hypothetical protein
MMPATDTPRPSAEDRIKAATWFAEQGFGVFSVWGVAPDGACRCPKGAACDNAGKHPIARQGFLENTRDPAVIRTLLSAASEPNYGLVCPDGVFVLDVDGEGVARLQQLQDRMGWLPLTLRTNTANGYHIFMRWPADLPRPIGQLFGYVTRWGSGANAGYVIGPRSIHATGAVYTPGEAFTIAELPREWAESAITPARDPGAITVTGGGYELPEPGYRGSRYDAIREFTASRYMRGISKEEIETLVTYQLAPRFAEALTPDDLHSRFERAWKGTPERLGPPLAPRTAPSAPEPPSAATDRSVLLSGISTDPPAPMLIDRLDPEGHTILYGTGGVGKGALASNWIAQLVQSGHRVLILDYEGHPEEWSRRIASLAPDVHRGDAVRHLIPREPLAVAAAEITWTCATYDLDYIVVDSVVMACGADPMKPEAAAAYGAGLVEINRPVLSLAHVTKIDDPRYPFGSVFWHNLARMTWSLTGSETEVLLKHRKHNNYPGSGTFTVTVTWEDGYLREVWEKGYTMTVLQRVLDALDDVGSLSFDQIMDVLNDEDHKPVSRKTLQQTLSRALVKTVRVDARGVYTRA